MKGLGRKDVFVAPLDNEKFGDSVYEITTSSKGSGLFNLPILLEFYPGLIPNDRLLTSIYKTTHPITFYGSGEFRTHKIMILKEPLLKIAYKLPNGKQLVKELTIQ